MTFPLPTFTTSTSRDITTSQAQIPFKVQFCPEAMLRESRVLSCLM